MARLSMLVLCAVSLSALAFPSPTKYGVLITAPLKPLDTGISVIPDLLHPFLAAGPNDLRGPCPALNTLANHGYLPRNGVASFEDLVNGVTRGYNMDYALASGFAAFAILARGNAFINKLSLGLESTNVPPLPGQIDGPVARGLAAHGRFEGDASMTRRDAAIGDHIHFQQDLFDQLLNTVAQVGDDSIVTGPKSIVNIHAMQEFKYKRFIDSQTQDKQFQFHLRRLLASYGEASLALNFFANGTDGTLSIPTMTSFFRDQRFPANWHRRSSPGDFQTVQSDATIIISAHPVPPGANDANGVYNLDPDDPIDGCSLYNGMARDNLPAVLLNTTGLLNRNVNFLLSAIHSFSPDCLVAVPMGPANT